MDLFIALLPKIEHLGLWAYWLLFGISTLESTAFFGLVVPGTTATIFAGFLATQDILDMGDVIWIVALGGIVGDTISFYLGRRGVNLFQPNNRVLKLSYLEKGREFFEKHGDKSLVLARFIGPIRPIIPFVAGLVRMNTKKFFLLNLVSGFISAAAYTLLGYFFGAVWGRTEAWFGHIEAALVITGAVFIIGYVLKKIIMKKINPAPTEEDLL